jgi:aarF domain-containing kinase
MIESELGAPLESFFSTFEEHPVAAASLAQVHRAVTASGGEQVAVKVQYPLVARQVSTDLWALQHLSRLVGWAFPGYGYDWVIDEFKGVALKELDFRSEAQNAAQCAAFFSDWPGVHVPATLPLLTSQRVLTMEWIDGAKLDDPDALAAVEVRPADVAPLLTAAFSAMIFESGCVLGLPSP